MKLVLIVLSGLLLVSGAAAQDSAPTNAPNSAQSSQLAEIPAGTALAVELSKGIDSRKAKQGDPVYARTTQDMLSNGKVVIPHDSKVTGHITEAQGRPKGQKGDANSTIAIVFDQLAIKGGPELPFHASIQAIGEPLVTAPPIAGTGIPAGGYGGSVSAGGGYPGQAPGSNPGNPPQSGTRPTGTEPPDEPGTGPQNSTGYPGAISVQSQGVIGLKGYALNSNDEASVISSTTENVKLEGGTQLILKAKQK